MELYESTISARAGHKRGNSVIPHWRLVLLPACTENSRIDRIEDKPAGDAERERVTGALFSLGQLDEHEAGISGISQYQQPTGFR